MPANVARRRNSGRLIHVIQDRSIHSYAKTRGEAVMDTTTLLIIILVLLLLGGGGYYGRGRWY
jgi:hypothetical protein